MVKKMARPSRSPRYKLKSQTSARNDLVLNLTAPPAAGSESHSASSKKPSEHTDEACFGGLSTSVKMPAGVTGYHARQPAHDFGSNHTSAALPTMGQFTPANTKSQRRYSVKEKKARPKKRREYKLSGGAEATTEPGPAQHRNVSQPQSRPQRSRYSIPEGKCRALLPQATSDPRALPITMGHEQVKDFFHHKELTKRIPRELRVFLRDMDGAQGQLEAYSTSCWNECCQIAMLLARSLMYRLLLDPKNQETPPEELIEVVRGEIKAYFVSFESVVVPVMDEVGVCVNPAVIDGGVPLAGLHPDSQQVHKLKFVDLALRLSLMLRRLIGYNNHMARKLSSLEAGIPNNYNACKDIAAMQLRNLIMRRWVKHADNARITAVRTDGRQWYLWERHDDYDLVIDLLDCQMYKTLKDWQVGQPGAEKINKSISMASIVDTPPEVRAAHLAELQAQEHASPTKGAAQQQTQAHTEKDPSVDLATSDLSRRDMSQVTSKPLQPAQQFRQARRPFCMTLNKDTRPTGYKEPTVEQLSMMSTMTFSPQGIGQMQMSLPQSSGMAVPPAQTGGYMQMLDPFMESSSMPNNNLFDTKNIDFNFSASIDQALDDAASLPYLGADHSPDLPFDFDSFDSAGMTTLPPSSMVSVPGQPPATMPSNRLAPPAFHVNAPGASLGVPFHNDGQLTQYPTTRKREYPSSPLDTIPTLDDPFVSPPPAAKKKRTTGKRKAKKVSVSEDETISMPSNYLAAPHPNGLPDHQMAAIAAAALPEEEELAMQAAIAAVAAAEAGGYSGYFAMLQGDDVEEFDWDSWVDFDGHA